jgi:hypothetical protein
MITLKNLWFISILMMGMWGFVIAPPVYSKDSSLRSQLLAHVGKFYKGTQDPSFLTYDLALRNYMVKRISKRFGMTLDPKTYSGFDLLEIESLFKFKKSNEPFELFLKMFPKRW